MAASPQFKELSSIFEISCLGVPASSRASLASSLPSSNPVTALSSLLKCQVCESLTLTAARRCPDLNSHASPHCAHDPAG